MVFDVIRDQWLAVFHRPFMHPTLCVMNIAIKKLSMIRIVHDLADG